jgi:predicted acylesterase/phospholipase RssA
MKRGVCDAENAEGIGRGHGLSQQFKRSGRAVLQGGGALGAYQVGVYQALHETGIKLNWIIGTSIGAINAGLIADDTPERRLDVLQEFWRRMQSERVWHHLPAWTGLPDLMSYWTTLFGGTVSSVPTLRRSWARTSR